MVVSHLLLHQNWTNLDPSPPKKYTKNRSGPCAAPGLARAGPGRRPLGILYLSWIYLGYIWIYFWYIFWADWGPISLGGLGSNLDEATNEKLHIYVYIYIYTYIYIYIHMIFNRFKLKIITDSYIN